MYAKANAPGFAHEGPLVEWLAQHAPDYVVAPLVIDAARGWVLSPDGGPTFDVGSGDWTDIVASYVRLQKHVEPAVDELRAIGVPYLPPSALSSFYRRTADATAELVPAVDHYAAILTDSGRITLEHNDLHAGNVFGGGQFFDWGDSVLTHPFLSLRMLEGDWRQRYFDAWGEPVDQRELDAAERLAPLVGLHPWTHIDPLTGPWAEFVADLHARLRRSLTL